MYYLGIEIGGTKLQLGIGAGDGVLRGLWRETVDVARGPEGIREQIAAAIPALLAQSGLDRADVVGIGIGFGGPVDDTTRTIIKSHQIAGWDNFPLADWITELVGLPTVLGNDADVAGLAEALFGAGKGFSPIFYITVGSGIGGGFIINGEIYRGTGRGAAEIGHLIVPAELEPGRLWQPPLEQVASGWAIEQAARDAVERFRVLPQAVEVLLRLAGGQPERITTREVALAAEQGDALALDVLREALACLAMAICQMIALLCPRRIIVGGGVSLIGEKVFFEPLRRAVAARVFPPFTGCYEIVPAALGEEVVVHGALALARRRFQDKVESQE